MPLGRQTVWVCRTLLQMGPDPSREGAILWGEAVASLPALGSWAPPSRTGPLTRKYLPVSLTVDLCESNKIISF